MKKYFAVLVFVILLWLVYNQFEEPINIRLEPIISSKVNPIIHEIAVKLGIRSLPCENPIPYTLGTFDTRFGIEKSYFLDALEDAEAIWEEPFGKELFVYEGNYMKDQGQDDALKVNLIYDYRQEATSTLADIGIVVKDTRASYEALRVKFTSLKAEFERKDAEYDQRVSDFNSRQKIYQDQVKYWNVQGGAPENEYNELNKEGLALKKEVSQLQAVQIQISKMANDINSLVVVLNRQAGVLNISVDQYNTIGAELGESFEEGVYQNDGINEKIDIYEFSSRDKLVRVLAHELGHALGILHVEDPKAIMYRLNQGNNKVLTQDDLDALYIQCEVETG